MSAGDRDPVPCAEAMELLGGRDRSTPIWDVDVSAFRAREQREAQAALARLEPELLAIPCEEVDADGVRCRLYRPPEAEPGLLVWVHGGAWMFGGLDVVEPLLRLLAARSGHEVLSVSYRLVPEHTYPAAIDDAWRATLWAARRFSPLAVGGESAGGNLAAAVAIRAREAGVAPALQVLLVPTLDYPEDEGAFADYERRYANFAGRRDFGATLAREIRFSGAAYLPDPADRLRPDAVPMRATSLAGLAPALIITAEHDILRDEARRYAARLRADGVPTELRDFSGQVHGFPSRLAEGCDGRVAAETIAAALADAFAGHPGSAHTAAERTR